MNFSSFFVPKITKHTIDRIIAMIRDTHITEQHMQHYFYIFLAYSLAIGALTPPYPLLLPIKVVYNCKFVHVHYKYGKTLLYNLGDKGKKISLKTSSIRAFLLNNTRNMTKNDTKTSSIRAKFSQKGHISVFGMPLSPRFYSTKK